MASRVLAAFTLVCGMSFAASGSWATEPRQFDYMVNCQGCHLPDGSGNPQRQVPAFSGQLGKFLSVPGGRAYLVQVPGSALSGLSDEALAGVLNWMLTTFSPAELSHDFEPYTALEVQRWRPSVPTDIQHVREDLLRRIARQ